MHAHPQLLTVCETQFLARIAWISSCLCCRYIEKAALDPKRWKDPSGDLRFEEGDSEVDIDEAESFLVVALEGEVIAFAGRLLVQCKDV